MESAAGINHFTRNSRFCLCYGSEPKTVEIKPMTLTEWKRRFDSGEPSEERLPDFCDECKKPVDKRFIEISFEQYVKEKEARLNEIWERYRSLQV